MRTLLFILLSFLVTSNLKASLSIEGSYQGKNLYIQNPSSEDGFGFCVTKVTVNNNVLPGDLGRSAFEIDFSVFNVKIGDNIFIVIEHEGGCTPKILNPEVLLPKSTFEVTTIDVTKNGSVKWTTTNEQGQLPYVIEQYRWSKWVSAGVVAGTGENGPNDYEFKIIPHSGKNIIRVAQKDHSGNKRVSEEIEFESDLIEVKMYPTKVKTDIHFTANDEPIETKYEVYDAYGNIVKKGFSSSVNCTNLRKGAYYINFDNKNEKFIKN
ncbi:MAG TPA: T9SS type A sorting domain-containing protein [Brumimicrobium sp.]|nr:T9SS type A sorting domain-containing protein [Brumimicrobium sp.]